MGEKCEEQNGYIIEQSCNKRQITVRRFSLGSLCQSQNSLSNDIVEAHCHVVDN